jgi:hypothetical protein
MFGRSATAERLFQFIRDVRTDEDSFTIDHFFLGAPCESSSITSEGDRDPYLMTRRRRNQTRGLERAFLSVPGKESKSVSRILYFNSGFEISEDLKISKPESKR